MQLILYLKPVFFTISYVVTVTSSFITIYIRAGFYNRHYIFVTIASDSCFMQTDTVFFFSILKASIIRSFHVGFNRIFFTFQLKRHACGIIEYQSVHNIMEKQILQTHEACFCLNYSQLWCDVAEKLPLYTAHELPHCAKMGSAIWQRTIYETEA